MNQRKGWARMKRNPHLEGLKRNVARELGVDLKDGYNGDKTTRETGSVGGRMVKHMIKQYEERMAGNPTFR